MSKEEIQEIIDQNEENSPLKAAGKSVTRKNS
jgi:hypothetical protein